MRLKLPSTASLKNSCNWRGDWSSWAPGVGSARSRLACAQAVAGSASTRIKVARRTLMVCACEDARGAHGLLRSRWWRPRAPHTEHLHTRLSVVRCRRRVLVNSSEKRHARAELWQEVV